MIQFTLENLINAAKFFGKRGRGGIPLPPTPSFRRARADFRDLAKLRQQFCSKWVRATFRISHRHNAGCL